MSAVISSVLERGERVGCNYTGLLRLQTGAEGGVEVVTQNKHGRLSDKKKKNKTMTSASQTNCFSCSAQQREARSAIMRGIQIKAPSSQLCRLYMAHPGQSLPSFQNWNFSFFVLVKWLFVRPDDAPILSSTTPPFVVMLMTHPSGFDRALWLDTPETH